MKDRIDLTVTIPINTTQHKDFAEYLHKALKSIEMNTVLPDTVLIVTGMAQDVVDFFANTFKASDYDMNIEVVANGTGDNFQQQMNFAASQTKTQYFSVLEFDDEFSSFWFTNVRDYITHYPEMEMFLPIVSNFTPDGRFIGFINEPAWAYRFSETWGQIDHEALNEYENFSIDGMVVKTESFIESGGQKPSMRFSFNYEFLLRFTQNGRNIMVIPRMGYKHVNLREGSLFHTYLHDPVLAVKPDEAKFWMDTARTEFFYKEDRNIQFNKS